MFHQRATVDRIAFFLSGFFSKGPAQDNILDVRKDVVRRYANRPDHLKHRFAAAIDTVVSRHQGFLDSIHSSGVGRGQTERDILSHKSFIPFRQVAIRVYLKPEPPKRILNQEAYHPTWGKSCVTAGISAASNFLPERRTSRNALSSSSALKL